MLGYRMFFSVAGDRRAVLPRVEEQLYAWLRNKGYRADALTPGLRTELGDGVEALLLEHEGEDGARSVHARITEVVQPGQQWVSELTVHVPASTTKYPWVRLDIDAPETDDGAPTRKWTATPRLARNLLEVLDARDGVARLAPAPQQVTSAELDVVLESLHDPNRRGLMFLAGSGADLPLLPWSTMVGQLLGDTVGMAAGYVLDSEATSLLRAEIGPLFAVSTGTVRTYLPGVDVTSELDSIRHRILTTDRIVRDDGRQVTRLLGWKAREAGIENPLPRHAARVARMFEQMEDRLLLDRLTTPAQIAPKLPRPTPIPEAERGDHPSTDGSADHLTMSDAGQRPTPTVGRSIADGAERYLKLVGLVPATLGVEILDEDALAEVARLAVLGRQAEKAQTELAARLEEFQKRLSAAEESRADLGARLEDEQLEHADAVRKLTESQELVRHLRSLLTAAGGGEAAWTPPPDQGPSTRPSSFDDLLARLTELRYIRFTGDKESAFELDHRDPMGTWAEKTWDILLSLEDYARASAEGRCERDVDGYLRNLPDDCRGFSAKNHARDESEDVKNNSKFSRFRSLPVPLEVDPSGQVFMGAHFRVAQSGMISPRLHYLDDTARTGYVYVGYIGRHLPTKRTN